MSKHTSRSIRLFKDADGKWRFRVVSGNGEIIAASEAYPTKAHAQRGARALVAVILRDAADSIR
jgi:uncharacterized protein YegP (UPF0339 family)